MSLIQILVPWYMHLPVQGASHKDHPYLIIPSRLILMYIMQYAPYSEDKKMDTAYLIYEVLYVYFHKCLYIIYDIITCIYIVNFATINDDRFLNLLPNQAWAACHH